MSRSAPSMPMRPWKVDVKIQYGTKGSIYSGKLSFSSEGSALAWIEHNRHILKEHSAPRYEPGGKK